MFFTTVQRAHDNAFRVDTTLQSPGARVVVLTEWYVPDQNYYKINTTEY
jgi:hypothetical protein